MDSFRGYNEDPQSLHKYLYTNGDPINAADPSGNWTTTETLIVLSIVAALVFVAAGIVIYRANHARWTTMIICTKGIVSLGDVSLDWNHVKARLESQTRLKVQIETGEISPRPKNCKIARIKLGSLDGDQFGTTPYSNINVYTSTTTFDENQIKKVAGYNGFLSDTARMRKFVENIVVHEMAHAAGVRRHPGEGSHPAVDPLDATSLMYPAAYVNNRFRDIQTRQDLKLDDYSVKEINSRVGNEK